MMQGIATYHHVAPKRRKHAMCATKKGGVADV